MAPPRNSKPNRVALYARVSTAEQNIDVQLAELRALAAARGTTVVSEYTDVGISGVKASRPGLDRMLVDAAAGRFDLLLVWKIDRVGRSLANLLQVIERLTEASQGEREALRSSPQRPRPPSGSHPPRAGRLGAASRLDALRGPRHPPASPRRGGSEVPFRRGPGTPVIGRPTRVARRRRGRWPGTVPFWAGSPRGAGRHRRPSRSPPSRSLGTGRPAPDARLPPVGAIPRRHSDRTRWLISDH